MHCYYYSNKKFARFFTALSCICAQDKSSNNLFNGVNICCILPELCSPHLFCIRKRVKENLHLLRETTSFYFKRANLRAPTSKHGGLLQKYIYNRKTIKIFFLFFYLDFLVKINLNGNVPYLYFSSSSN